MTLIADGAMSLSKDDNSLKSSSQKDTVDTSALAELAREVAATQKRVDGALLTLEKQDKLLGSLQTLTFFGFIVVVLTVAGLLITVIIAFSQNSLDNNRELRELNNSLIRLNTETQKLKN